MGNKSCREREREANKKNLKTSIQLTEGTLRKLAAASRSMSLIFCPICMMLEGLMSPCMKPLLWTNRRAEATCFVMLLISSHSVPKSDMKEGNVGKEKN